MTSSVLKRSLAGVALILGMGIHAQASNGPARLGAPNPEEGALERADENQLSTPYTAQDIAVATREACRLMPRDALRSHEGIRRQVRAGFPGEKMKQILSRIRWEAFKGAFQLELVGLTPTARLFEKTSAFMDVIEECYGDDPIPRNFMTSFVRGALPGGKILGVGSWFVPGLVIPAAIQKVRALGLMTRFLGSRAQGFAKWGRRLMIGAGVGIVSVAARDLYLARQEIYKAGLIILNERKALLEGRPELRRWLTKEMHQNQLAVDGEDLLNNVAEQVRSMQEIARKTITGRIDEMQRLMVQLQDPQAKAELQAAIDRLEGLLKESYELERMISASPSPQSSPR